MKSYLQPVTYKQRCAVFVQNLFDLVNIIDEGI